MLLDGREPDLGLHHEGPVHAQVVHHSVHIHRVLHLHLLDQPVDGDERPRPPDASAAITDTDRLFMLPPNHLLTAGLIKSQGSQDDASYYFSGMSNKSLGSTEGWLLPPPRGAPQPCMCTGLYIQALERTSFPAQFSTLGEMLCSYDILYPFLCYLHSTASF